MDENYKLKVEEKRCNWIYKFYDDKKMFMKQPQKDEEWSCNKKSVKDKVYNDNNNKKSSIFCKYKKKI